MVCFDCLGLGWGLHSGVFYFIALGWVCGFVVWFVGFVVCFGYWWFGVVWVWLFDLFIVGVECCGLCFLGLCLAICLVWLFTGCFVLGVILVLRDLIVVCLCCSLLGVLYVCVGWLYFFSV